MTRIAVVGSTGQLGGDVVRVLTDSQQYDVLPLGHDRIDVTDSASVREVLAAARPDVVVNCAGFVRVDDCEDRPDDAFRVNAYGALHVAQACSDLRAWCVYVSTDYVFDGEKGEPYVEDDAPRPINVYGTSKVAGEAFVQQACPRWMITRVASLYGRTGARGKGGNFVETVLAQARAGEPLRVVDDIRMSPVYTYDAARAIKQLIGEDAEGTYHTVNGGSCTWFEFARTALRLAGLTGTIVPVPAREMPRRARRPKDSSLQSARLRGAPAWARAWPEALRAYLQEGGHLPAGGV